MSVADQSESVMFLNTLENQSLESISYRTDRVFQPSLSIFVF